MEIAISAARWAVGRALGPVSDGLLESWAASSKLGPNIRDLKLQLLYAQGMLNNARGRDVCNPALGQLLQELRIQAYDADDVLDELEYFRVQDELDETYETTDTEARGLVEGLVLNARHTAGAVVSKLKLPSCSCASVVCHHRRKPKLKFDRVAMSKRMVDIVEQLKPVCAMVSTILDLELQGAIASTSTTALQGTAHSQTTRNTTPQIIEPKLYGRDDLKKDVIDKVTSKYCDNDGLTVLSIVGPGGLGKTTLTQHIYKEVKSHFQVLIWVCVSQNFSASRLTQEILKQIPKLDNETGNESAEDLIEKRLQSKRFLLVFDDMWTDHEDEWKKLLAPFKKIQTKGNMVIVTTRIPKVAQMVTAPVCCQISLKRLSDEECTSLFKAFVFDDQQPWEGHTNLHDFGHGIVKRLKGFPLAVKTVGRLLKTELTVDHWRRVLESKEWEYQASEDDIMPALKLSYNYLPFHLQQCFSHCSLFPEDYEFGREELIHLWIGLGLLGPSNRNKRIEDIGLDYLRALVSHGFLEKKEDGSTCYVIHDLLHDLARNVSAHECITIQGSNVSPIQIPASIHHLSIIINNSDVQDKETFENCKETLDTLGKRLKARNLRTLMLFGDHHGSFCKIFSGMFRDAKTLRVIFISGALYDVEVLLHSFSQLVHLRYLRIKGYVLNLRSLFDSISRFYNLLVLDIKECDTFPGIDKKEICSSTRDMSNLVNIRHFLVGDNSYHCGIFEVKKLKYIQELRRFEVKREEHGFELKQLGKLVQLQGSLEICNLEKVGGTTELDELKLVHLQHLNRLILGWVGNQSDRDPKKEQDVLEFLKPHNNLQELCIRGHGGDTYPTWLCSDHSAKNLECLCLKGVAWKSLPPLLGELLMVGEVHPSFAGQIFLNLKRLELVNIATLKKWSADIPFSKLEVLTVQDCSELTELPSSAHMFPILQQIYISNCEELVSVPPIPWSSYLSKAKLRSVGKSIQDLGYWKKEQRMSVAFKKDALGHELWNVLAFSNLSEIEGFVIKDCPPVPLHQLQLLNSLKLLEIYGCTSVLWPAEGDNDSAFEFPIEQLVIGSWGATVKELVQLISYFPSLSTLELVRCRNKQAGGAEEIEAAAGGQLLLPLQLKELLQNQSSLRSLGIWDCPMLLSSPSSYCPFPASLHSLSLGDVKDGMLSLAPLTNLTKLSLSDCGGLRSEDLWHLLAQGRLKELQIRGAHNLLDVPESLRMCGQGLPQHSSRLQALETGGETGGAVALPIGVHFSSSLTELALGGNDLEHFPEEQLEALQMLTSLQVLRFGFYSRLVSLPEGFSGLPNLKRLTILSCHSLRSLPKGGLPSSLVVLVIDSCKAIQSLPKGTLPSSLVELQILYCHAIRSLSKGTLPSSLKILSILDCPAIRSLHEGSLPKSLQKLDVTGSNEKLQRQCWKLQGTIPIVKLGD